MRWASWGRTGATRAALGVGVGVLLVVVGVVELVVVAVVEERRSPSL